MVSERGSTATGEIRWSCQQHARRGGAPRVNDTYVDILLSAVFHTHLPSAICTECFLYCIIKMSRLVLAFLVSGEYECNVRRHRFLGRVSNSGAKAGCSSDLPQVPGDMCLVSENDSE